MKDHVTLKTGVMAAYNSALHHNNKLHFKIYLNRKYLLNCNNIYNIIIII